MSRLISGIGLFLLLSTLIHQPSTAFAQGTAFTYQGRLTDNGAPATGYYDMLFSLYDAASGGAQVDGTLMGTAVPVTNGLFTIPLDFGPGIFTGPGRWLKLDVRTNGGGAYIPLSPRQALTATPYAITAGNVTGVVPSAGFSGTYGNAVTLNNAGNQLTGNFAGNGASVSNVNALTLGGLGATSFWKTGGNAGTTPGTHFLGTTDNQPLELKVNGQRALRIEPNTNGAPNVIGGSSRNFVAAGVVGAVIGGGGAPNYLGFPFTNSVAANFGTIGGGGQNTIQAGDDIYGFSSTIAGGSHNTIQTSSRYSTIGGGYLNTVQLYAESSTIGGGSENRVGDGASSTIAGGFANVIGGPLAVGNTIGGGQQNAIAEGYFATIAGGVENVIGTNSFYSAIGGGEFNDIAAFSFWATIAGGGDNDIGMYSDSSTIGGGSDNRVGAGTVASTIAGGAENYIGSVSVFSAIGGGWLNAIGTNSPYGAIGGGETNRIGDGSSHATIAGGAGNNVGSASEFSAVGGGVQNRIGTNVEASVIGGGEGNSVGDDSHWAGIASGYLNSMGTNAYYNTIGGGGVNSIAPNTQSSTIPGGYGNSIGLGSVASTIGGGFENNIGTNSSSSSIGGGTGNVVTDNAENATIPGGYSNSATNSAFAAGTRAKAVHTGAFVWGDSTPTDIASTNANSWTIRVSGGVRFFSDTNATAGVSLAPGGTAWAVISDRNAKKDFAPVDSRAVLEKLAALPITQWHYRWEEPTITPHIGPMAQDFKAAFYPGSDDKSITTQEADGVALAAIQGLNQKLEEQRAENAALKHRLAQLEQLVSKLTK